MSTSLRRGAISLFIVCFLLTLLSSPASGKDLSAGFEKGDPKIRSAMQLAFGPEGILFVADARAAAVVAIDTGDSVKAGKTPQIKIDNLGVKIAALLGISPEDLIINDLAVNPLSGTPYLAVSRGRGPDATPVILRAVGGSKLEVVDLQNVKFSRASIPDAPAADAETGKGRRRRKPRQESITDLAHVDGRVLVAGLSSEEFSSSLRAIPFPFSEVGKGSIVTIFHGAHGRFETRSPVRTFVPYEIDGQLNILAAYQCTPLVQFPVSQLRPGARVTGKTIAELGNRNRPLDMITYSKGGKEFLLIANSSRGIMKVPTAGIGQVASITEKVARGETEGQPYETVETWKGIHQLDRLDSGHAVVVRQTESGASHLESRALP